jgi:hypothetical protein
MNKKKSLKNVKVYTRFGLKVWTKFVIENFLGTKKSKKKLRTKNDILKNCKEYLLI